VWASLLLLLVAAGSATAGIISGRDTGEGSRASGTIVAISPVVTAPPAPPVSKPQPKPAPKPTRSAAPSPGTATAPAEWPARNGYTVVLASIPARGSGLDDARAKVKAARERGVAGVGILVSARFASLHPGYYVVFAGVYESLDDAQTAANRLSGRYPNAYARQITR
jgi:hypothetical protein